MFIIFFFSALIRGYSSVSQAPPPPPQNDANLKSGAGAQPNKVHYGIVLSSTRAEGGKNISFSFFLFTKHQIMEAAAVSMFKTLKLSAMLGRCGGGGDREDFKQFLLM